MFTAQYKLSVSWVSHVCELFITKPTYALLIYTYCLLLYMLTESANFRESVH